MWVVSYLSLTPDNTSLQACVIHINTAPNYFSLFWLLTNATCLSLLKLIVKNHLSLASNIPEEPEFFSVWIHPTLTNQPTASLILPRPRLFRFFCTLILVQKWFLSWSSEVLAMPCGYFMIYFTRVPTLSRVCTDRVRGGLGRDNPSYCGSNDGRGSAWQNCSLFTISDPQTDIPI